MADRKELLGKFMELVNRMKAGLYGPSASQRVMNSLLDQFAQLGLGVTVNNEAEGDFEGDFTQTGIVAGRHASNPIDLGRRLAQAVGAGEISVPQAAEQLYEVTVQLAEMGGATVINNKMSGNFKGTGVQIGVDYRQQ